MTIDRAIHEKLLKYIIEVTFLDKDAIKDETLLFEEGIFDSMGLLFLIDFIRDTFHIDTKDSELLVENFASVNRIAAFISKRIGVEESKKLVISGK